MVGNTELIYSASSKSYYLELDNFLLSKELFPIIKMMIGCRAYQKKELRQIISKLLSFTSAHDKSLLYKMILKEMDYYHEVNHDCDSVINIIWQLTRCIDEKREITITYFKMDRNQIHRRIRPLAIMFSEYYYYLIAGSTKSNEWKPLYYRVDRITNIVEHREKFELEKGQDFNEGQLRNKIQYMFPGKYRKIKFEFSGPSIQAILDKIPTARVVGERKDCKIVEAETYGTGINMVLLSQGSWVKVLEPKSLVEEMKHEVEKLRERYDE